MMRTDRSGPNARHPDDFEMRSTAIVLLLTALVSMLLLLSGCQSKKQTPLYPVTIINKSSHDVCSIKFFLSGSYHLPTKNRLRKSLFRTRKLAPGQQITVYVARGVYDIRIETCDGLGWGEDAFSVPPNDEWSVSDDRLTPLVQ